MKHKLILFYGSSSGAGKSTLSSWLHRALRQTNVPAQWLYEDDVQHLDLFAPVIAYMRGEGYTDMPSACLAATARLVTDYADSDTVVIADSILPYYDWLLAAGYDEATLQTFNRQLQELVCPLDPLIVYLKADIATVLQRAVDQRGEQWLRDLILFMNTWIANKGARISDQTDVIAYLQRTDRRKIALLSAWAGDVLWLDSAQQSIDACATTLLNYLELPAPTAEPRPLSPAIRQRYLAHYTTTDADPPDGERDLVISLRKDELWANLYWPNGCRLMAESEQAFQLEDTSHRLVFDEPTTEYERCLYYHYCGKTYTYHAVETLLR
jgi:thymidylate kinase